MTKINEKELKELFIELKMQNQIGFEKLYAKYKKLVYGIAFTILKNKEDSEDIVQIVFERLYKMDKEKLPTNKESSWLYTVTKNEAISLLRKRKNTVDLESIYEIEEKNDEINNIIDQDSYNRLISKLNDKEKEIIYLKVLANLSFDEIGKLLKEPTGTVKWRYYKSMHTLKILLSNLGMFIITFTIGLKTLFKQEKKQYENLKEETTEEDKETTKSEESDNTKSENIEDSEEIKNTSKSEENEYIFEGTTIPTNVKEENNNYLGIGILSISGIFLIMTIIFTIFFTKYQLKLNKKTSK